MARKGFKILDHPADLGIEAFGKNLKEAFGQAAVALMSVILDPSTIEDRESRIVDLSANDYEHMLVKWLTEVLYLYDGQGFVGCRFEVLQLTSGGMKAIIRGEQFDEKKHATKLDVKAVTYHQLKIEENRKRASLKVYLDV